MNPASGKQDLKAYRLSELSLFRAMVQQLNNKILTLLNKIHINLPIDLNTEDIKTLL
jgi:hypothetical protein